MWGEADLFDRVSDLGFGMGLLAVQKAALLRQAAGVPSPAWLLAQSNFPAQGLPERRLLSAFRLRQLRLGGHSGSEDTQPHHPASIEGALGTSRDRQPGLQAGQGGFLASSWVLQYSPG